MRAAPAVLASVAMALFITAAEAEVPVRVLLTAWLSTAVAVLVLNQATRDWHNEIDSALSASATFPNSELFPLCRLLFLSPLALVSKRSF